MINPAEAATSDSRDIEFIRRANIERFRDLLSRTLDENKRQRLINLIAEEKGRSPPGSLGA
jgi:hypothetical protein